ncbi:MAG: hypothetical protein IBX64_05645 [Actinobacteria bacterium]|nr:hypothetical protein [Actinomycetota bacterium]
MTEMHVEREPASAGEGRGFLSTPSTKLGRWSVMLAAAFVALFIINATVFMPSAVTVPWRQVVLPFFGIVILSCGLAAGITGLVAVIRCRERSLLVWLTILPGLMVLAFVLGEFLIPH